MAAVATSPTTDISTEQPSSPNEVAFERPQKTSFLDLPNEIRNEIYKLAIYDRDKGSVILPHWIHLVRSEYDDEETDEEIGIPEEPGILRASKEIREQCLPIYYWNNTFEFRFGRFLPLNRSDNYSRAYNTFRYWALSIQPEHAVLIGSLTLVGQHSVRQSVEFDATIYLFDEEPHFELDVDHDGNETKYLNDIRDNLDHNLRSALKQAVTSDEELVFSPQLIVDLGGMFVDAMDE